MEELKCIQINLQHSKSATAALHKLLSNSKYDIAFVQEPYTYKNEVCGLNLCNSHVFRIQPCPDGPVRALAVVKKNLNCWLVNQLSSRDVTAVASRVTLNNKVCTVLLVSLYLPFDNKTVPPTKELEAVVDYCTHNKYPLIIGCDSNSHHTSWGSTDVNKRGQSLLGYLLSKNLEVLNVGSKPTFHNSKREEVLDLTICNQSISNNIANWQVLDEASFSDHNYISFEITNTALVLNKHRNPKKTDWLSLRSDLQKSYTSIKTIESTKSLEEAVTHVTETLRNSYNKFCPERISTKSAKVPWWNSTLAKLRKQARKAGRNVAGNAERTAKYRAIRAKYKKELRKAKRKSWSEYCESIKSLSDTAKLQKILTKDRSVALGMLKKNNGEYTNDPAEMLQILLETHFPECVNGQDMLCTLNVSDSTCSTEPDWKTSNQVIDNCKVLWAIEDFKPYKSAGADGIFPALLQHTADTLLNDITMILRACIAYSYIPRSWRLVKIIFIPKPGKEYYDIAKSFRPISLTSYFLKTLEKLIYQYLKATTLDTQPFHKLQFAYQEGKSTITALQQFVGRIESTLENKGFASAVFMDIEGAFDNVPFDTMLAAIKKRNIPQSIYSLIEGMLRNRIITAQSNGFEKQVRAGKGSPQGGVLSPLLWNMVVDDLLERFQKNSAYAFAYADDITTLVTGKHQDIVTINMQRNLNIMEQWCKEVGLRVNPLKSSAIIFTRNKVRKAYPLKIFGQNIPYTESVKLLGVTLDRKLLWNEHCQLICRKAISSLMQCRRSVGKTWGLTPKVMLWLYTLVIRPIFSYSAVLWYHRLKIGTIKKQLISVQRLALLCISGAHHSCSTAALETLLCIPPLDLFLKGEAFAWYTRNKSSFMLNSKCQSSAVKELQVISGMLDCPKDNTNAKFFFEKSFRISLVVSKVIAPTSRCVECYTDGSRTKTSAGAGVFVPQLQHEESIGLGKSCTVFQAEMFAILRAATFMTESKVSNCTIGFFTDSLASVKSLNKVCTKSGIVQQCIAALNKLGEINKVYVAWIKGHSNCPGNDHADYLARMGSTRLVIGPEPFLPLLNCTWKLELRKWVLQEHTVRWRTQALGALTKKFGIEPNHSASLKLVNMNRRALKCTIDILTGHCALQKHLHTLGLANSPLCLNCGEEEQEDVEHFLCSCEAFSRVRKSILGKQFLCVKDLKKVEVGVLWEYIKATQRFD